jgi:hypothetical protein
MKVNARDWTFELGDGDPAGTGEVFTQIGGITSMEITQGQQETDTTDFASAGNAEHEVMERSRNITVTGHFDENPADGTRDAGQEAVETLANAVGADSLRNLRVTSPGATTWTQLVSARLGAVGGGNNDKSSWGATFVRSGATTKA